MTSQAYLCYDASEAAESTARFTQEARDYFAPIARSREVKDAFASIIRQLHAQYHHRSPQKHGQDTRELGDIPFLYMNGKSRRWQEYGKQLADLGCLDDVHSLTAEYLDFLRRINGGMYREAVSSRLRQLNRCWDTIESWKKLEM